MAIVDLKESEAKDAAKELTEIACGQYCYSQLKPLSPLFPPRISLLLFNGNMLLKRAC